MGLLQAAVVLSVPVFAEERPAADSWQQAESRVDAGEAVIVFVEAEKTPGRPAFKIETAFDAPPRVAAFVLMQDMMQEGDLPKGQRRRILASRDHEALVHTFIDLPFLLADRELALRIVHREDARTGIHRIEWQDANDVLPAAAEDVVRLSGTRGHWEFRPAGESRTHAIYLSQTEIGGSIPAAIGDRLMRAQAVDAVSRLRDQLATEQRLHVAAPPPPE